MHSEESTVFDLNPTRLSPACQPPVQDLILGGDSIILQAKSWFSHFQKTRTIEILTTKPEFSSPCIKLQNALFTYFSPHTCTFYYYIQSKGNFPLDITRSVSLRLHRCFIVIAGLHGIMNRFLHSVARFILKLISNYFKMVKSIDLVNCMHFKRKKIHCHVKALKNCKKYISYQGRSGFHLTFKSEKSWPFSCFKLMVHLCKIKCQ